MSRKVGTYVAVVIVLCICAGSIVTLVSIIQNWAVQLAGVFTAMPEHTVLAMEVFGFLILAGILSRFVSWIPWFGINLSTILLALIIGSPVSWFSAAFLRLVLYAFFRIVSSVMGNTTNRIAYSFGYEKSAKTAHGITIGLGNFGALASFMVILLFLRSPESTWCAILGAHFGGGLLIYFFFPD